jgi:hypothetical protein
VSGKPPVNVPVTLLSVPLAGDANVFCTQVDVTKLAIGRYGPKIQPVPEQFRLVPVCAAVRPLTVQVLPTHTVFIWVSAPAGVGPSATVEPPPPTFNPPYPRLFRIVPLAPPRRTVPQLPVGGPVTKLSRVSVGGGTVVEVVLVLVIVVLLVRYH